MNDNADYRYRDDAFDLRRASDNPLLENQLNKNNWDKSNKIVGFNVDVSLQNQQIFEILGDFNFSITRKSYIFVKNIFIHFIVIINHR
jgi:alpha-amylase/alpha-mannosidase (GH57 family)